MPRLYEAAEAVADLEATLLENGGEITDELDAEYAQAIATVEGKMAGCVALIRQFETEAEALKIERARLDAMIRTRENGARRVKNLVMQALSIMGADEARTPLGRFKIQYAAPPLVLRYEAEALPDHFKRVTVEANKQALAEALRSGDPDAALYAEFGERQPFVRIYGG